MGLVTCTECHGKGKVFLLVAESLCTECKGFGKIESDPEKRKLLEDWDSCFGAFLDIEDESGS